MIRPATPADAEAVRAVVDASYGHYVARIGKSPGPMLDDYVRRIADGQAWVLEHDGRIVGTLVLAPEAGGLLLDNIAVLPDSQGKGFGRILIGFAETEARGRGCDEIHLYTHMLMHENIALYRRLGFVETARRSEKGYDRVYMTKHL
jgi:GNAT superfamily N-acetyltransferase